MAFTMNNISLEERFAALDDEKARFVSKVYSGLTFSLVVATIACFLAIQWFSGMSPSQAAGTFKTLIIVEVVMCIASMFIRMSGTFGWLFLLGFVTITGVTLAPVLMMYYATAGGATIAAALGLTAAIFVGLSAYVRYSGKDFSYLGGFLWMATLGLIVTGILMMFWPSANVSYWRACIGSLIFCGWILFDTSAVSRQYYRDNNVVGAILALYVDILNLFLMLLQILGGGRRDD
jgi:uncharacterized protein